MKTFPDVGLIESHENLKLENAELRRQIEDLRQRLHQIDVYLRVSLDVIRESER